MKKHLTFLQLIDQAMGCEAHDAEMENRAIKKISYDDLDDIQKEMLTGALMREAKATAYEYIVESDYFCDLVFRVQEITETNFDYLKKEKLFKEAGKMLLECACHYAKKQINESLAMAYDDVNTRILIANEKGYNNGIYKI